jgi:hypothetical protein
MERRYRRLLRLLPGSYRQIWEQDMVVTLLDTSGPTRQRPSIGERLSVLALALRLRLGGSHATPRGMVWQRAVYGFALLVLLYQALEATALGAQAIQAAVSGVDDTGPFVGHPMALALGLLWVPAFWCLATSRWLLGYLVAAVLLIALSEDSLLTFRAVAPLAVLVAMMVTLGLRASYGHPTGCSRSLRWASVCLSAGR